MAFGCNCLIVSIISCLPKCHRFDSGPRDRLLFLVLLIVACFLFPRFSFLRFNVLRFNVVLSHFEKSNPVKKIRVWGTWRFRGGEGMT